MRVHLQKREGCFILLLLAISAVFIGICSKCSPLYPMNDWVDVDCYHTVAKSIVDGGRVLYQDIFDHKGPSFYLFYCTGYLISKTFLGTYILEVICLWISLYFCRKILKMYISHDVCIMALVTLYAFIICTSSAFVSGGSSEEICMPMITYSLYYFLRLINKDSCKYVKIISHIMNGVCVGLVFFSKYTLVGFYIGAFLFIVGLFLKRKQIPFLLKTVGYTVLGFIISIVPLLLYFGYNNALGDFWTAYFYNNIFLYTIKSSIITKIYYIFIRSAVMVIKNIPFALTCIIGFIWLVKEKKLEVLFFLMSVGFAILGIYIGGRSYSYYALILFPNAIFGLIAIGKIAEKYIIKLNTHKPIAFARLMGFYACFLIVLSFFINGNAYLIKLKKSDLPQFQFAEKINMVENPTMLNYDYLDGGFYYAAGIIPQNKYFYKANIDNPEMIEEQNSIVENKGVDFVVTCNERLEDVLDIRGKYVCIDDGEGQGQIYYLYKKCE